MGLSLTQPSLDQARFDFPLQNCNPANNAAGYVPPGYIVLDHRSTATAATVKTSLDDVELNNSISSV